MSRPFCCFTSFYALRGNPLLLDLEAVLFEALQLFAFRGQHPEALPSLFDQLAYRARAELGGFACEALQRFTEAFSSDGRRHFVRSRRRSRYVARNNDSARIQ